MPETAVINDAVVMSKGEVIIPQNIRSVLGISPGDRVKFVVEKGAVRVYAAKQIQKEVRKTDIISKDKEKKMEAFRKIIEMREKSPFPADFDYDKAREEAMIQKYGRFD